ncbi:MAG: NUDIX hydrolase [Bradyrhizobiaceae bacterium]|nr:NUDIX hydrolase [Bradyrhizobiaceae bacterium]
MKKSGDLRTDEFRLSLIEMLIEYGLRYPEEQATVQRYTDFVQAVPDCFERSSQVGHVTAAAWLVDPSRRTVLLTHHAKLNKWLQLGGHADGNGDVHSVALTEAREESGIGEIELLSTQLFDVDIHPIPARGNDPAHFHFDVRFTALAAHTQHVVSSESHDLAWVPIDRIHLYNPEESLVRMATKWFTQNRSYFDSID